MAARVALTIGINNYPGTDNDLAGCVNDANDWARVLSARGFEVRQLLERKASGSAIRKGIEQTIARASEAGDTAIITFAGHGTWVPDKDGDEPDRRDEGLCPWDLDTNGPLIDDELYDLFAERERGARVVFISDSCHSGTVVRMLDAQGPRVRMRFMPPSRFMTVPDAEAPVVVRSARPTVALLMAAAQDNQYAADAEFDGRPAGVFTHYAIEALQGLRVGATYLDWFKAIRERLPSAEYSQRPNLVATKGMRGWRV